MSKTPDEIVDSIPEDQQKAVWHKLGERLHKDGGVTTQGSGNDGPPPPPTTKPHP